MEDLIFDYGWRKKINFLFQNKEKEIELVFSAYKGQEVLDIQKDAFEKFVNDNVSYQQKISVLLSDYISKFAIKNPQVSPQTLLIDRNGSVSLLCDCSWDIENGIAIVLEPEAYITVQDDLI